MDLSKLENVVKDNARDYYTTGEQELDDDVFDAVINKIKEENPNSDVLTTGWGYKPDSEDKVKHKYCHIGSLQKVKTLKDLSNELGPRSDVNIAAKLDGMSCVLYYVKGKLDKAVTRGDGTYGIDITEKLHYVKGFTYSIKDKSFTGAVRGEIFMTPQDYDKFKLKYSDAKNARNSTAGIMNSNIGTYSPEDYGFLSLYVYTVVASEVNSHRENITWFYTWLENNFEYTAPHIETSLRSLTEAELLNLKSDFEQLVVLDGLVITRSAVIYNSVSKAYQYDQVAWKFQDEVKIATVKHIEWTASKHNAYIPVVVFEEPIELEGTQVLRATGYNAKWIKDMKIKAGSIVAVRKANQIIPQIIEVIN